LQQQISYFNVKYTARRTEKNQASLPARVAQHEPTMCIFLSGNYTSNIGYKRVRDNAAKLHVVAMNQVDLICVRPCIINVGKVIQKNPLGATIKIY